MKVILLQPPIQDFYETDLRLQPIGLCYLKSAAERHIPDAKVIVKDYHRGYGRRTIAVPVELRYLKSFYPFADQSPFSSFHNYFHFGADYERISEDVAAEAPDLVGISSLFSPYYREVLRTAEAIKQRLDVPIVVGGGHASAMPELMLKNRSIDFVIRGEGELPLVRFLEALLNRTPLTEVPALCFRKGDGLHISTPAPNFPLDKLPPPDFSDLSPDNYLFEGKRLSFVVTSRSCPHRCSFCSVHQVFGKDYRRRDPELVVQELVSRYRDGVRVFDFEDDNLTFYQAEMKYLCRRLIEVFPERDARFLAMNGISYLSLDIELLRLMKQAGFTNLNLSLVSSDETVLRTTKRPHTVKKYREVVEAASELGFNITSYQIIGLPFESLDSMVQTLVYAAGLPVLLGASIFYLTPQSPIGSLFPVPTEHDVFKARLTAIAVETNDACADDLYTLFVTTRIINFLKASKIGLEVVNLSTLLDLTLQNGDRRSRIGAEALRRLLAEGVLYGSSKGRLVPLPKFKAATFEKVWGRLRRIRTTAGGEIHLNCER